MGTVTGYTADKINELLANGIVNAVVDTNNHLILTTRDGTVVDAGPVGGNTTIIGRQVGEPVFWLAPLTAPIPTGFLVLEGGMASRVTYADLWTLWGTTYGAGDGVNTFGLPDMRKKSPFGYDSTDALFNAIGKTGGSPTHTLTAAELNHRHQLPILAAGNTGGGPHVSTWNAGGHGGGRAASVTDFGGFTGTASTFSGYYALSDDAATVGPGATTFAGPTPHSIMPPYIVGRWLVKAAYTGAEINPNDSHVHAITDVTGLRTELDALKTFSDLTGHVWKSGYKAVASPGPKQPLVLRKGADGRYVLNGMFTNAIPFSWTVTVQYLILSLGGGQLAAIPPFDVEGMGMVTIPGTGIDTIHLVLRGSASGSAYSGSPGDLLWQPNVVSRPGPFAADSLAFSVQPMMW